MSGRFYSELWLATRKEAEEILRLDQLTQNATSTKNRSVALDILIPMYISYRELTRRLAICHDQVCQSQKRDLIKRVLDRAIGRMLEYKKEIVRFDATEFQYPDNILTRMKFTPDDIAFRKPSYFLSDRQLDLDERKKNIIKLMDEEDNAQDSAHDETMEAVTTHGESRSNMDFGGGESIELPKAMTKNLLHGVFHEEKAEQDLKKIARKRLSDAILLIQSHDRARRSRIISTRARSAYERRKKAMRVELEVKKFNETTESNAAIVIQKNWRSYATRQRLAQRSAKMDEILGATIPSWQSNEVFQKDAENVQRRQQLQRECAESTRRTISNEKARVYGVRGPGLMEDLTDEIREWFIVWYNQVGFFDIYPSAKAGGSVLVATGQTSTPEEYVADKSKNAKTSASDMAKRDDAKAKASRVKDVKVKEKATGWRMPGSKSLKLLEEANEDFIKNWSLRDESGNAEERAYVDLVTDKLFYELQLEIRKVVDDKMRLELAKLEVALGKDQADDKDSTEKSQKSKGTTMKKKKKKKEMKKDQPQKGEKKNRKKKKKKKEQLANESVDELFSELVKSGIIRNYPEERMSDWKGDVCYQNFEARRDLRSVRCSIGDVAQPIMEYCILPCGSKEIHRLAPLIRSVCIVGPSQSGKSFLTNAVCSEIGALLFDLTPNSIAGKYQGKSNESRLVQMVNKVARAYAPSVIFVDGGDKPWWKKIPKDEKDSEPKRLAGILTKLVKDIKSGDQILVLTTSDEPYKAGRQFAKIHDKFIRISMTDYNTLYILYQELLMKYHGVDRHFDCSSLAKMSIGFPIPLIREAVENVMTVERRISLKRNPLKPREIMEYLISHQTSDAIKENELFQKWERKTTLGKKRAKIEAQEKVEFARDANETKKKKKV